MEEEDNLLDGVKEAVVTWGGTLKRSYGDGHGQYAIRFTLRGETYIGVAKQQPERGLASFMQKVARRAADQDVHLVEFFGATPTLGDAFVFRADTVLEDGDESHGDSKLDVPTDWYELPLGRGCLLGDYLTGNDQPAEPRTRKPEPRAETKGITDYA